MGLLRPEGRRGGVRRRVVTGREPYRVAQAGIGLVPEGRQIFPTLTVEENLVATASARQGRRRWTLDAVYDLFPRLQERRGNLGSQLSGGEQQMLAIGRALMTNPKLMILDEATEGLAPLIRAEIWDCLKTLEDRAPVDPRHRQERGCPGAFRRPARHHRKGPVGLDRHERRTRRRCRA